MARLADHPVRQFAPVEVLDLIDGIAGRVLRAQDRELLVVLVKAEIDARPVTVMVVTRGAGIKRHADQPGIEPSVFPDSHGADRSLHIHGFAVCPPALFHVNVLGHIDARHEDANHRKRRKNQDGRQDTGQHAARLRIVPTHGFPFARNTKDAAEKFRENRGFGAT